MTLIASSQRSKGLQDMRWLRLSVIAGLLLPGAAMAADMPGLVPPPVAAPPAQILPSPANAAWYLRGDLGYYWGRMDGAQSAPGFANPSGNDLGNSITGGVGVGVKTRWLRTDVTLDYTAMKYTGTVATPGDTTAKVSAITALFNGYLDLGSWYGLTPYVGAGAGVSDLRTYDYTSTAAPPFAGGLSHTQWKFAWALMGGVGYTVAPNILVDLGYRYMDFGDVTTASDASGAMILKNLAAHEVRVGVRWSFDDSTSYR
jgi:opacity protein-like surface antigen